MSTAFNLYPVLTDEMISAAIPAPANISFFYYDGGAEQSLQFENKTEDAFCFSAELRDPKCDWYPETHELNMQRSISIGDVSSWFGENGVVPESATIGIAQQWISVKSETRGIIPMGDIQKSENGHEFSIEYVFPKNTIKGSLLLKTIVYLKNIGIVKEEEKNLCSQTGTVLGEIDSCEIFVDGNGSVFPIATIDAPGQPLWMVYFDETADPMLLIKNMWKSA